MQAVLDEVCGDLGADELLQKLVLRMCIEPPLPDREAETYGQHRSSTLGKRGKKRGILATFHDVQQASGKGMWTPQLSVWTCFEFSMVCVLCGIIEKVVPPRRQSLHLGSFPNTFPGASIVANIYASPGSIHKLTRCSVFPLHYCFRAMFLVSSRNPVW